MSLILYILLLVRSKHLLENTFVKILTMFHCETIIEPNRGVLK